MKLLRSAVTAAYKQNMRYWKSALFNTAVIFSLLLFIVTFQGTSLGQKWQAL